ncbi:hypothetical protein UK23_42920 [Lentzea aerocolonigenes]|uniref:Histidine kinase/HSP90-like ATPase domain-containing protein n=1 Tax=Lentzea aerocolonigenes TaxID=68170 RepID=A0A0F0GCQ2_LENAE|nr:hypothetical protein UK23_42920 [Lentzea aerocolonigenes]
MVATPVGRLDLSTYAALRDGLLKCVVDTPAALVVRLGPGFECASLTMLAVFDAVWMRVTQWPDIPMVLVTETEKHRHELRRCGVTKYIPAVGDLAAALEAARRPPPRRYRRLSLPQSPAAPMLAREAVREACAQWDLPRLSDDAVLVVSELVENAVRHARSAPVLRIELRPSGLSLAVQDDDPAPPTLFDAPVDAGGHRGVQLVDRICRAWGCTESSDGGKIVWAVLGQRKDE